MDYYSDREGFKAPMTQTVSNTAWQGIVSVIEKFIKLDCLSEDFPMTCEDGGSICGFNERLFNNCISSVIPTMSYPFPSIGKYYLLEDNEATKEAIQQQEQYAVLDTIEFVFSRLRDPIKDNKKYHEFYRHYELSFGNGSKSKVEFRESLNEIFRRNGIAFTLTEEGQIERILPTGISYEITSLPNSSDDDVNGLISTAIKKFMDPKFEERRMGIERLWDAFERIKTTLDPKDKKTSADRLLTSAANGNEAFKKILNDECKALTDMGNNFKIRHHEVGKEPIDETCLDYFFYRMLSMILLMLRAK